MTRGLALLLALLSPQDARKWAEAVGYFTSKGNSREPLERSLAVEDLGKATYEKQDKACWQLVSKALAQELARDPGGTGKAEEKVSALVVEACVGAMKKLAAKDAVAEMAKAARDRGKPDRFRMYVLWGLGGKAETKDLLELAEEKSPLVQIAAVDALAEKADPAAADFFMKLLKDERRPWEAKHAALAGLRKTADDRLVTPLVECLAKLRHQEGRMKSQFLKVLQKATGLELDSDDPKAWTAAWAAKQAGKEPPKGSTVAAPSEFYGVKTHSSRFVFLLDRTTTMKLEGSEPKRLEVSIRDAPAAEGPAETRARDEATKLKGRVDDKPAKTRIEAAKKELISAVYYLSPQVQFNVIWYDAVGKPWKPALVPATWQNKYDCLREAERALPGGTTNLWDAFELAFKMVAHPDKPDAIALDPKANYATCVNGADTFFLLSDGKPNEGRIPDTSGILYELRKLNRLRRVTIHTICLGDERDKDGKVSQDPPDPEFMKKIAEESGGDFVHIKE